MSTPLGLGLAEAAAGCLVALLLLARWFLIRRHAPSVFTPQAAPPRPVAIVLGAGLRKDGFPTDVLADRVQAAADLYRQGKVGSLLMSGASHGPAASEPGAMRALALSLGVPAEAILVDAGGSRTYATCERARRLFGIEQAAVVSQRFHLPRALALCQALGIQAIGVAADRQPYGLASFVLWTLREIPATLVALAEIARLGRSKHPSRLRPSPTSRLEPPAHGP
jgi:SanA protein